MCKAKFTKGIWEVKPIEDDKEYIRIRGATIGGTFKIANVIDLKNHHDESGWCKRERLESQANAHLIASAPKMYAMLEEMADYDECQRFKKQINQLLAKARGEHV